MKRLMLICLVVGLMSVGCHVIRPAQDSNKPRCSSGEGHWEQNGTEKVCIPDNLEARDACGLKRDEGVGVLYCRKVKYGDMRGQ